MATPPPTGLAPSTPWWVRMSWLAPAVGTAGNVATLGLDAGGDGSRATILVRLAFSVVWVLFLIAGFFFGGASIIGAIVKRRPLWALHGALGVLIPSALAALALVAFMKRGH